MQVKDLSVKAEKLDEVRGGSSIFQSIFNGSTSGASIAVGGDVGSTTSSESNVLSAHTNTQSAIARDVYTRTSSIGVFGSKGVGIGSFGRVRLS